MTLTERSATGEGVDFTLAPEHVEVRDRIVTFMHEHVLPREAELDYGSEIPAELIRDLRARARETHVYGPTLPRALGGLGLNWRGIAVALEEAGVSLLGPQALNCAAPDEGNMHLLQLVANDAQKQRYLEPLAAGKTRSCFAMTEPAPGAGADPSQLCTVARQDGDAWVIDGRKWFTTGADGAAFAIVMAKTSDVVDGLRGATLFLVEAGTDGFVPLRRIGSLDHTIPGGHGEVLFEHCRVPDAAILGEVGRGLEYAQLRLGPARLTHCMRWLGIARRALDIALGYAAQRHSFGQQLAEHQQVQAALADSEIELHAARMMIWHGAWTLDRGQSARHESSMTKVFVAEAVNRVVDRALQICGALGVSEDLPLSLFYREVRPFRIYDGPSEVHRASIARRMVRRRA
jgi:acyl-CoA dehydrogenase